jgi:hypothetical protein
MDHRGDSAGSSASRGQSTVARSETRNPGEIGQTLVFVVLFMVVSICFIGVVVDGGMFLFERRDMQGTADAAALAAVRELPGSTGQASSVANDYVTSKNSSANGLVKSVVFSDANRTVQVTVHKTGTSNFSGILGITSPDISASATARVQMMGPRPGMLPMAFMRDSFTVGTNYDIKFDSNATGNRGAIAPDMGANCTAANGADDFGNLIRGAKYGGIDACATPIAETLDTETGNMVGKTKAGFDDRLVGNTDSYEDVFKTDPATGYQTIEKPDSPRIGIVPVIENINGGTTWPNGQSQPIRILAYMLVYIGDRNSPPNYPATTDGKTVWVTPVRPILPADFPDGAFVDYDASLPAPVVYRLVA